ncbi:glycine cleavage system protein GcvH [Planosporangium thailandense]|uniref:Glycine cleavage system H protein n=1 Tax=Planosporangium thailandense TaxID=765197 RepID=A0ABX0Y4D1_9ACTN|nr:glycine cleavage system protein GcvH [Planosporangium thailandense]NJC73259.1 glycine cleavage system protein GcvH [Planosporangium thailandense]
MNVPTSLSYTGDHEWLSVDGEIATVGISAFAAEALGDIVYLELPEVGAALTAGEVCGEIESTKSVSELYTPVTGEVLQVNDALSADPGLVNADPYGEGWLFRARFRETVELLDAEAYAARIEAS